jgi:hypothetical protein
MTRGIETGKRESSQAISTSVPKAKDARAGVAQEIMFRQNWKSLTISCGKGYRNILGF